MGGWVGGWVALTRIRPRPLAQIVVDWGSDNRSMAAATWCAEPEAEPDDLMALQTLVLNVINKGAQAEAECSEQEVEIEARGVISTENYAVCVARPRRTSIKHRKSRLPAVAFSALVRRDPSTTVPSISNHKWARRATAQILQQNALAPYDKKMTGAALAAMVRRIKEFSALRNTGADILVCPKTGKTAVRLGTSNINSNSGTTSNQHLLDVVARFNACGQGADQGEGADNNNASGAPCIWRTTGTMSAEPSSENGVIPSLSFVVGE